jgi:hypothetical protein
MPAVEGGFALSKQIANRSVEHYCNAFASEILIPPTWLQQNWAQAPMTLQTIRSLSDDTLTSQANAATALGKSIESWRAVFMLWRCHNRSWYAPTCIIPSGVRVQSVQATDATGAAIQRALDEGQRSITVQVPMCVNGESKDVECEIAAMRQGAAVLAYT